MDVISLAIKPGFLCYFESSQNFLIEGNDQLQIRYFEYEGYGPDIMLHGSEACKFKNKQVSEMNTGVKDVWFRPNLYGGACKYLVLLSCPARNQATGELNDKIATATITRQYLGGASVVMVSAFSLLTTTILAYMV